MLITISELMSICQQTIHQLLIHLKNIESRMLTSQEKSKNIGAMPMTNQDFKQLMLMEKKLINQIMLTKLLKLKTSLVLPINSMILEKINMHLIKESH